MPIYEYQCEACHVVEEIIQKMSDPTPASCSSCGKGPMVKLMSMTNFALKGSGWYVTDFRDKASAKKDIPAEGTEKVEAKDSASNTYTPPETTSEKVSEKPIEKSTPEGTAKATPAAASKS